MSTHHVPLGFDDFHHLVHILLANLLLGGLHHDTEDRLGAGLPHQDAPGVPKLFGSK